MVKNKLEKTTDALVRASVAGYGVSDRGFTGVRGRNTRAKLIRRVISSDLT